MQWNRYAGPRSGQSGGSLLQTGRYNLSNIQTQQLFFIDETGALCSKHSGHAIDITGESLPQSY